MSTSDRWFSVALFLFTIGLCSEVPMWWRVVLIAVGVVATFKSTGGCNG